mgnify:FL=1
MFETACDVYLRKQSDKVFVSMNIKLYSMGEQGFPVGEAQVADRLGALVDGENPTVATYAKEDGCLVRVTAAAKTTEEARALLAPTLAAAKAAIGENHIRYVEED